jgi:hypothetical protein
VIPLIMETSSFQAHHQSAGIIAYYVWGRPQSGGRGGGLLQSYPSLQHPRVLGPNILHMSSVADPGSNNNNNKKGGMKKKYVRSLTFFVAKKKVGQASFSPLLLLFLDPGSGINIPDPQHRVQVSTICLHTYPSYIL